MGLTFDAWMFYPQLPELVDLLRTFPDHEGHLKPLEVLGIDARDSNRDDVFGSGVNISGSSGG